MSYKLSKCSNVEQSDCLSSVIHQNSHRLKVQTNASCYVDIIAKDLRCDAGRLSFFPLYILLMRYCSDHHGDKPFHDAVAIEPIEMLRLCTLFIFTL